MSGCLDPSGDTIAEGIPDLAVLSSSFSCSSLVFQRMKVYLPSYNGISPHRDTVVQQQHFFPSDLANNRAGSHTESSFAPPLQFWKR